MINAEKIFNVKYKEAGKKRSISIVQDMWDIDDVIKFFMNKNITFTHIEGENEITIHNRFATKSNIKTIKENSRCVKVVKRDKYTTIILL